MTIRGEICGDCKHRSTYNSNMMRFCRAFDEVPYGFAVFKHDEPFIDEPNPIIEGETVTQEGDYIFEWVCGDCAHSHRYHPELRIGSCLAYPDGIPGFIKERGLGINHKEEYYGQEKGYIYEPHQEE